MIINDRFITVTMRKEGIHRYPEAGTNPALADVSFLSHPHRHIFHISLTVEVFHDNRDIEFIQLKRWLEGLFLSEGPLELNNRSCEMICIDIAEQFERAYTDKRDVEVQVFEDGENGARLRFTVNPDR